MTFDQAKQALKQLSDALDFNHLLDEDKVTKACKQIAEVNQVPVGRVRRALAEASRRLAPRTRNRKDLTPEVVREAFEAVGSLAQAARKLGTTPRTLRLRLAIAPVQETE
jgi:hypothetical protein